MTPLLQFDNVTKSYDQGKVLPWTKTKQIPILHGISLTIARGETLGVVGESGSGKSTLGRMALRLVTPSSGRVVFDGHDITAMPERTFRPFRARIQMIFQDPQNSLNPALSIGASIAEALEVHRPDLGKAARDARIGTLLTHVGLSPAAASRRPHEFSGGQKQRVGIARALAVEPDLIVADEAVSALDVSVQAHILNLMRDLRDEPGLAYLFIAHDLAVVRRISHRVAVLYRGRIVELADRDTLFGAPLHPYTQMLLEAVPRLHSTQDRHMPGQPPQLTKADAPVGCPFYARCPMRMTVCLDNDPVPRLVAPGHEVACHVC